MSTRRREPSDEPPSAEAAGETRPQAQPPPDPSAAIEAFVEGLSESERMLVVLRDGLYDGDWNAMLGDLRARLAGRPFIFKLVNRIQDDIALIEKLSAFEREGGINLADYLEEGGQE